MTDITQAIATTERLLAINLRSGTKPYDNFSRPTSKVKQNQDKDSLCWSGSPRNEPPTCDNTGTRIVQGPKKVNQSSGHLYQPIVGLLAVVKRLRSSIFGCADLPAKDLSARSILVVADLGPFHSSL